MLKSHKEELAQWLTKTTKDRVVVRWHVLKKDGVKVKTHIVAYITVDNELWKAEYIFYGFNPPNKDNIPAMLTPSFALHEVEWWGKIDPWWQHINETAGGEQRSSGITSLPMNSWIARHLDRMQAMLESHAFYNNLSKPSFFLSVRLGSYVEKTMAKVEDAQRRLVEYLIAEE